MKVPLQVSNDSSYQFLIQVQYNRWVVKEVDTRHAGLFSEGCPPHLFLRTAQCSVHLSLISQLMSAVHLSGGGFPFFYSFKPLTLLPNHP